MRSWDEVTYAQAGGEVSCETAVTLLRTSGLPFNGSDDDDDGGHVFLTLAYFPEISPVVTRQGEQKSVSMEDNKYKPIGAVPVREGTVPTSHGKTMEKLCARGWLYWISDSC